MTLSFSPLPNETLTNPLPRLPPDAGDMALMLADLSQQMFDAAVYWRNTENEDRAIQCHQSSALYMSAALQAYALKL